MRIITYRRIREFVEQYPSANVPINDWYDKVSRADWNSFAEIRQMFNTVDYVGNKRYVFNVGGNNYRLVAIVLFHPKTVFIRFIGTHKQYEKIDCKTI